ncbi:hypothetical protein DICPUDRAFT_83252 [Dictyostelium purpureum]|uniref:Transmembrane protein n=1 Tax=Dictyostelium purpureum TaxID=5786 RepID=F0ZZ03_DICPU|nr:uncharacterized protein DICPUDRAFT_83252 [Dictyostelium purpureum]EGC30826.1 hypothetical protein DICPUDRAFT_83252 [Dictyostelium purpureum]|eukprot:XP_003292640.1 hypothetical protein DICPUDRAFT_83252 [Dictyostelium purpureum]
MFKLIFFIFFINIILGFEIRYLEFEGTKCNKNNLKYIISATECSEFGYISNYFRNNNTIEIVPVRSLGDCQEGSKKNLNKNRNNIPSIIKVLNKCYTDFNYSYYYQISLDTDPIKINSFGHQISSLNYNHNKYLERKRNKKENNQTSIEKKLLQQNDICQNYLITSFKNGSCSLVDYNENTSKYYYIKTFTVGDKIHEYSCINECYSNSTHQQVQKNCQIVRSSLINQICNSKIKILNINEVLNSKNTIVETNNSLQKNSYINIILLVLQIIVLINIINYL